MKHSSIGNLNCSSLFAMLLLSLVSLLPAGCLIRDRVMVEFPRQAVIKTQGIQVLGVVPIATTGNDLNEGDEFARMVINRLNKEKIFKQVKRIELEDFLATLNEAYAKTKGNSAYWNYLKKHLAVDAVLYGNQTFSSRDAKGIVTEEYYDYMGRLRQRDVYKDQTLYLLTITIEMVSLDNGETLYSKKFEKDNLVDGRGFGNIYGYYDLASQVLAELVDKLKPSPMQKEMYLAR